MLEFTEMNGDQLPYEKLREIIASFFDDGRKFECYTRVSSTARLLWWRLKILQEFKHSNSRISRTDRTTQTEMDFEMKLKVLEEEKLLIKQRLAHVGSEFSINFFFFSPTLAHIFFIFLFT